MLLGIVGHERILSVRSKMSVSPLPQVKVTTINYKKCVICQKKSSGTPMTKDPKTETLNTLLNKLELRNRLGLQVGDISYNIPYLQLKEETVESLKRYKATFHRPCYQKLINTNHVERIESSLPIYIETKLELEGEPTGNDSNSIRRQSRSSFDKAFCFFCQHDDPMLRSDLHEITSKNGNEKLIQAIKLSYNHELMVRMNSACDARAGDYKYHRKCWAKNVVRVLEKADKDSKSEMNLNEGPINTFSASIIINVINAVKSSILRSEILFMRSVHSLYSTLMQEVGMEDQRSERSQIRWLKEQLMQYIPGLSIEKSYKSNESSQLCYEGDRRVIMELAIRKLDENKTINISKMVDSWKKRFTRSS